MRRGALWIANETRPAHSLEQEFGFIWGEDMYKKAADSSQDWETKREQYLPHVRAKRTSNHYASRQGYEPIKVFMDRTRRQAHDATKASKGNSQTEHAAPMAVFTTHTNKPAHQKRQEAYGAKLQKT